jgi:hypothetical protein
MLEPAPSATRVPEQFFYENMQELVADWQAGTEMAIWEFLGISESAFKNWIQRIRDGVIDA